MALVFRLWDVFDTPAWNLRFLPFWYLGLFLLAAVGVAEIVRGAAVFAVFTVKDDWWHRDDEEYEDDTHDDDRETNGQAPTASRARADRPVTRARALGHHRRA